MEFNKNNSVQFFASLKTFKNLPTKSIKLIFYSEMIQFIFATADDNTQQTSYRSANPNIPHNPRQRAANGSNREHIIENVWVWIDSVSHLRSVGVIFSTMNFAPKTHQSDLYTQSVV